MTKDSFLPSLDNTSFFSYTQSTESLLSQKAKNGSTKHMCGLRSAKCPSGKAARKVLTVCQFNANLATNSRKRAIKVKPEKVITYFLFRSILFQPFHKLVTNAPYVFAVQT